MHFERGPAPSIGLLHILEDAAGLIQGKTLEPGRSDYVLGQVRKLVDQAIEGSKISKQEGVFVLPGKWQAMESYTLLSRYLGEESTHLDENVLEQLSSAVTHMSQQTPMPEELRIDAFGILREICEQMGQDVDTGISPSDELQPIAM
jgi:hypothetical protein